MPTQLHAGDELVSLFPSSKEYGMKILYLALKTTLIIFCIALLYSNHGCRDPYDFEPEFDSLSSPPAPPQLLAPENGSNIWYDMWNPYPNDIELRWTPVPNTQNYEVQISTNSAFPEEPDRVYSTTHIFTVQKNGKYYWRVRAYNRSWTWYTEWSDVWYFNTAYSP